MTKRAVQKARTFKLRLLAALAAAICISLVLHAWWVSASTPAGPHPQEPPNSGGADWSVWGGPNRNFRSAATGLADSWPAVGPPKLWKRTLGEGYSPVAIEGDRLYTMYSSGKREVVTALDAGTGKTVWEHSYETTTSAGDANTGPGPYAMPQVLGDRVVSVGGTGRLHSIDKQSGKAVWSHDLYRELGAERLMWGYSCHALSYKNLLILLLGGAGHSVAAFRQDDGRLVWAKHSFPNSHSSPLLIDVDGQAQVVALMGQQVISLDPMTGDLLWQHPHPTQYNLAISTPVWGPGNILVVSSAYDGGTRALHLRQRNGTTIVRQLWHAPRLRVHFGTMIRIDNTIYASSGQSGPAPITAFDVRTGRILWQSGRQFAKAQLLHADGKLILIDEDGVLALATATRTKLQVHSRVDLLTKVARTPPSLAGTRLYVRDRKQIMALELGAS